MRDQGIVVRSVIMFCLLPLLAGLFVLTSPALFAMFVVQTHDRLFKDETFTLDEAHKRANRKS